MLQKLKFHFIKITRFEFWPYGLLYIPVYFYYLYLSLKAGSITFFTAANPGFYIGGFVGVSKKNILDKINKQYLPATLYFKAGDNLDKVKKEISLHQISFPLIVKPDVGERGKYVEKADDEKSLKEYLSKNDFDFIIQELVAEGIELGILYYHFPDGSKSGITSVVIKEFLNVRGDGKNTLRTLIGKNMRAQGRLDYLFNKFHQKLDHILEKDKTLILEPIGNHVRGTKFLSGNYLINDKLVKVFDEIGKKINGFYIGRFDLKVRSIPDLYEGKNIRIMELNGVSSEPAHIYDPSTYIINAYRALFLHYKLVYIIAMQNKKKGIQFVPFRVVWKELKRHFQK